ncbi:TetR/AcrR family transcriptional regulator [Pseudomonas cichorii]|uniref:TetR/AcrR family transcriptional regulator n=1 Tax=Pseudomonas cichorii TaxID=36746 RepID=UPI001C8A62BD|nr:TetR/AcrR family transcriptional regulator [Pseudomonas cichorii]MBX8496508.1 TetR/AcrR family transcriptional regulator [Pseudomonas cichorii]MBX8514762.1 TetR/AcrR family transcriptional regulator [Pseudomonas cichorii]MBX8530415.1 TetR/AcrR family transcriptional regulator [Pseudomonas cichorii]
MPNTSLTSGPGRPKDPEKRKAILEAAKDLFVRHGYGNTSMDSIAAEAGVSKLTVYSHFTDKETLFSAAVVARCEEQMPALFVHLSSDLPVETVLLNVARAFQTLINSPESLELNRLMVNLGIQDPKLSRIFFEAGPQRILNEMERLLIQIDKSGELRIESPKTAAEHFLNLVKGLCHFRLLVGCGELPATEEAEQHVREVVEMFMRAYRVQ